MFLVFYTGIKVFPCSFLLVDKLERGVKHFDHDTSQSIPTVLSVINKLEDCGNET